jgi:hypothetical protein
MIYSAAIPTNIDTALRSHLIRQDGQEDLCFALWNPSRGETRTTALVNDLVLPLDGDRYVHGNASFESQYVERVVSEAMRLRTGIAFLHSHLGPGWQGMSPDDVRAEIGLAGRVMGATGLPLVGLTVGTDGAWSARFWEKSGPRKYDRRWASSVRVAGDALRTTFNDSLLPAPRPNSRLVRTISAWGDERQAQLARLRIGVVGAGSVGCLIAESLARMGIGHVLLIDFDSVEEVNLDRLLHATQADIGRAKVEVLAAAIRRSATADNFRVQTSESSVVEKDGFLKALDCDLLFSCVDRPWARFALNLIAYAHLIPVVDGGIAIRSRAGRGLRHCSIRAHAVAPGRRCLECLGQYNSGLVSVERDGLLDDPSYIEGLPAEHELRARENVFGFSAVAAALETMQMLSMVISPSGASNPGAQIYHFVSGDVDKVGESACGQSCYFRSVIAKGDRVGISCIGEHHVAERERALRRNQRPSWWGRAWRWLASKAGW